MRDFMEFFVMILIIPLMIVLVKLCFYLWDKPFQEWWTALIWVLVLPITLIIIMYMKHEGRN